MGKAQQNGAYLLVAQVFYAFKQNNNVSEEGTSQHGQSSVVITHD